MLEAAAGLMEPVFFWMDAQGNPLFADGKLDPRELPHCGLNYSATRNLVRFKDVERDKKKVQVKTGYEMFPYDEQYDLKGQAMVQFEVFMGEPFIKSADGEEVSSWAESGDNPPPPRRMSFLPDAGIVYVNGSGPEYSDPNCGVRRLLRGRKKA